MGHLWLLGLHIVNPRYSYEAIVPEAKQAGLLIVLYGKCAAARKGEMVPVNEIVDNG